MWNTARCQKLVAAAVILAATLLTGSCGSEPTGTQPVAKSGTGEVRADLQPLTTRFSALGTPVTAVWMSGTLGDDDIPGPSTYWIDAIAQVEPDVANRLRTDLTVEPANDSPAVIEALAEEIPSGVLLTGPELNDAFSASGFMVQAYISQDSDRVVLVAIGQ